jgi:hypothetical protein
VTKNYFFYLISINKILIFEEKNSVYIDSIINIRNATQSLILFGKYSMGYICKSSSINNLLGFLSY